jgi:hypothetical protein
MESFETETEQGIRINYLSTQNFAIFLHQFPRPDRKFIDQKMADKFQQASDILNQLTAEVDLNKQSYQRMCQIPLRVSFISSLTNLLHQLH